MQNIVVAGARGVGLRVESGAQAQIDGLHIIDTAVGVKVERGGILDVANVTHTFTDDEGS